MQTARALDMGGMERKATEPSFYAERTLAEFLAVSDRTIRTGFAEASCPARPPRDEAA